MPTDDITLCFEQPTFEKIAAAFAAAVQTASEKEGCPRDWMRVRLDRDAAGVLFSALVAGLEAGQPAADA